MEVVEIEKVKVEEVPIAKRATRSSDVNVVVAPPVATAKSAKVKASAIPKKAKSAAAIKKENALKESSSDQITDDSARVASKRKSRTSQNAAANSSTMASPVAPGDVEAEVFVEVCVDVYSNF